MAGLVTVIIPVRDRIDLLREAVDSALGQTYRPLEIVIVDDGSGDEAARFYDDLAGAHREIEVIHQINRGPGLSREAGRQAARGEFIQYLDSDDLLEPNKLEAQVTVMEDDPSIDLSYGRTRYFDPDGNEIECTWRRPSRPVDALFPYLLVDRIWETSSPLYRKRLSERVGSWSDLWLEEDWEYDCRVALCAPALHFVEQYVAMHRDHSSGRLSSRPALDPWKLGQRTRAHEAILNHALAAGVTPASAEMQRFSRELFLLARQCGAAGLLLESRRLFELSRSASGERGNGLDFRLYALGAGVIGWRNAGRFACWADRFRSDPEQDPAERSLESS